jgi:hypothetical protein
MKILYDKGSQAFVILSFLQLTNVLLWLDYYW